MKKRDFIFIAAVFCAAALLFSVAKLLPEADTVYIYKDTKLIGTYSLNEPQTINIDETNTAVIEKGYVYMKDATCPDKLCIKQGRLSDSSKTIVCLPNKVVISTASGKTAVDTVAR